MSRRQRINALITSKRSNPINPINSHRQIAFTGREPSEHSIAANCELDLQADTSVARPNFTVIEYTDLVCNVSPFSKFYEHRENVPIVKAATTCDNEKME
jgi:hypothetical protein